jgi:ABC-2 type transport system permease protein
VDVLVRLRIALLIFIYDLKKYYSKAPVISWGILAPLTMIILLYFSAGYFGYSRIVPAMFVISLLFASTSMSQVAISFEKMSGSMNMLLFLPISSGELVIGKLLGGVLYGFLGTLIAGVFVVSFTYGAVMIRPLFFYLAIILGSLIFSYLSILIAFVYEPIKAVALLNIIRFIMIFLGGVIIPKPLMPQSLLPIVYVFPSVYIIEDIRFGLYNVWDYIDPYTSLIMTIIYLITLIIVTQRIVLKTMTP